MRRKFLSPAPTDSPTPDTSSLVDVSFLLLIFFLVSATLMKRETDLSMVLPTPRGAAAVSALPVWIGIGQDGGISLGTGAAAMPLGTDDRSAIHELSRHLRTARDAVRPDALPVVLDVDDAALQQRFIDVIDCLAALEIDQITLVEK